MTHPIVNGQPAETGCYVDGHWGQYGPDHLADRAEEFGWEPLEHQDPRVLRELADMTDGDEALDYWQRHSEAADEIETWLNDRTSDGYVWYWRDGEFFLSPICDEGDCDDDTCAHWD